MPKFPLLARHQQCRRSLSRSRRTATNSQSPQSSAPEGMMTSSTTTPPNSTEPSPTLVKAETTQLPLIMALHDTTQASRNDRVSLFDTAHPSAQQDLIAFLEEKETGDTYSGFFYNRTHIFVLVHDADTHAIIAKGKFPAAEGGRKALDYVLQMPGCKANDYTLDGPVGQGPREQWAEEAMKVVEREALERGKRKAERSTKSKQ